MHLVSYTYNTVMHDKREVLNHIITVFNKKKIIFVKNYADNKKKLMKLHTSTGGYVAHSM